MTIRPSSSSASKSIKMQEVVIEYGKKVVDLLDNAPVLPQTHLVMPPSSSLSSAGSGVLISWVGGSGTCFAGTTSSTLLSLGLRFARPLVAGTGVSSMGWRAE